MFNVLDYLSSSISSSTSTHYFHTTRIAPNEHYSAIRSILMQLDGFFADAKVHIFSPTFTASYRILPHLTAFYRLGGRLPSLERQTIG